MPTHSPGGRGWEGEPGRVGSGHLPTCSGELGQRTWVPHLWNRRKDFLHGVVVRMTRPGCSRLSVYLIHFPGCTVCCLSLFFSSNHLKIHHTYGLQWGSLSKKNRTFLKPCITLYAKHSGGHIRYINLDLTQTATIQRMLWSWWPCFSFLMLPFLLHKFFLYSLLTLLPLWLW